jgi:hypothetical protein
MSGTVWTCDICGRQSLWGSSWRWYGSLADLEEAGGDGVVAICSDACAEGQTHRSLREVQKRLLAERGMRPRPMLKEQMGEMDRAPEVLPEIDAA